MRYKILARDNGDFVDVFLNLAMLNFAESVWRAKFTLDKARGKVLGPEWEFSPNAYTKFDEVKVELADVPSWCRTMADRMKPQIIAEHFQALIDNLG